MTADRWHRFWKRVSAKAFQDLPDGYEEVARTQQKDRIIKIVLFFVLLLMMLCIGIKIKPIDTRVIFKDFAAWCQSILCPAIALPVVLKGLSFIHEYIHLGLMKAYGGTKVEKPKWEISGAYVKSDDYYKKTPFIIIVLAPVAILGLIILVFTVAFPKWFWFMWILQMNNICGAAGDFTYTAMLIRKPESVLVIDSGKSLIIYDQL